MVLFKGSALAQTYYPAPWLRPCTDSDILIAKSDRLKYDSILNQLKFKKLLSIEGELVSYQSTYVGKLTQQSSLILDLHWRINNRQTLAKTYSVNELIDRGETIENLDHSVIMPSAIDCILLSCVHRLGHHANDERLIWLYDIHVLANTLEETDWQKLCLLCKDKQIAAITLDALLICEDLFDTPIPTDSKQTLKVLANRNEASKLVLNRSASELHLFIQDLKSLDSFSLKLKLLKENLLPCADYIRESMNTNSLLKGHLKRAFRGIKRITKRP